LSSDEQRNYARLTAKARAAGRAAAARGGKWSAVQVARIIEGSRRPFPAKAPWPLEIALVLPTSWQKKHHRDLPSSDGRKRAKARDAAAEARLVPPVTNRAPPET
jgi:hypothetical protein